MIVRRITRRTCGQCFTLQRLAIEVDPAGVETLPACYSCGPTTWLNLPHLDMSVLEQPPCGTRVTMMVDMYTDVPYPAAMMQAITDNLQRCFQCHGCEACDDRMLGPACDCPCHEEPGW